MMSTYVVRSELAVMNMFEEQNPIDLGGWEWEP